MSERSLTTNRTAAGPISLSDGGGAGGQVGTREIGAMDEERRHDALYPGGLGVGCEGWSSCERVARVLLRPNASSTEGKTRQRGPACQRWSEGSGLREQVAGEADRWAPLVGAGLVVWAARVSGGVELGRIDAPRPR
jgi:hypothetical protein